MRKSVVAFASIGTAIAIAFLSAPVSAHGPSQTSSPSASALPAGGPAGVATPAPTASATPAPTPTPGVTGGAGAGVTGRGAAAPRPGGASGRGTQPGNGAAGIGSAIGAKKVAGGAGRTKARWSGVNHSPSVCQILDFAWVDADWPTQSAEGYATTAAPLSTLIHQRCFNPRCTNLNCHEFKCQDPKCMRDKKPALVYIYDPNEARDAKVKRDKEIFGSDDVASLMGFVHCFHMAADEREVAEFKRNFGTKLPALVFLSPTGATVDMIEGQLKHDDVLAGFDKVFTACFSKDMKAHLAKYKDVLRKLEKCEDDHVVASGRVFELEEEAAKGETTAATKLEEAKAKRDATLKEFAAIEKERVGLTMLKIVTPEAPKAVATAK